MRKEGLLLIVIAMLIVLVFVWPRPNPYRCYIVHHRKDGSCPPGYVTREQVWAGKGYFIEPDGSREDACMDLRTPAQIDKKNPVGVGLGKDLCVDYFRPGEKGAFNPKFQLVLWN